MPPQKRRAEKDTPSLVQSTLPFKKVKLDEERQKPEHYGDKTIDENISGQKPEGSSCKTPTKIDKDTSEVILSPSIEEKRIAAKMKLVSKKTFGIVDQIGSSWFKALEPEFTKPYFEGLCKFLDAERKSHTIYPPPDKVFTWTQMTPINKISAIIVGQDPYHGPNQAHGLCFSVPKGVAIPPSLDNMYKELGSTIEGFKHPGHGNLIGWAEQGVLLLNSVLTVRQHSANSHKDKGWENFTDAVMSWFNHNTKGTVFILWGSYAQKKGQKIDKAKHHVLRGVHPSPLSAHRGFFGCNHFKLCNELLKKEGKMEINWNHLP